MQLPLAEYYKRFPDRPPPVPMEYAGKWIAWNEDHSEILVHGSTFHEVRELAAQCGCKQPIFQKVPRGIFIG